MRRLARWTARLLAACSLLLCLAAAALWVRSHAATDTVFWTSPSRCYFLAAGTAPGQVHLFALGRANSLERAQWLDGPLGVHHRLEPLGQSPMNLDPIYDLVLSECRSFRHLHTGRFHLAYVGHDQTHMTDSANTVPPARLVSFPCWAAVAATAPWPLALALRRLRARRRRKVGHCTRCGYDLTANVSGVCPECGNAI